ncbi:hypothetical protein TIFTF001_044392 [Ficus carica]|uniref:Uncharacterized protein n=1 Tax=Ficus carica TaxID=3494 RepID=A0AA87ZV68_FICCA|nr:hypothetical protein TIFTF001_044391 [Ficus carica]GMN29912.1 hypothetical protein TIFTF001_044392 [Ficus carica]
MELRLFLGEFFDAICVTDCGKKDMLLLQLAQHKIRAVNSAASPAPPPASPAQDSGQQIWLPAQPALLRPQSQPARISGRILTQQPVRPVSSAKQPASMKSAPSAAATPASLPRVSS